MAETSQESIIMTLLDQIRSLEDERDKALKLASEMSKKNAEAKTGNGTKERDLTEEQNALETVLSELEEIRLNEEQRQFNLKELKGNSSEDEGMNNENYKEMLVMCKKYYGKMVSELQQERGVLQTKVQTQQNELLEKDMIIAELQMKLGKHKS